MQRCDRWRRLARAGQACAIHLVLASSALAQDSATGLTQGRDVVTMPGIGRVILAFLLTAGLAVAIVYALRRYSPKFTGGLMQGGSLRVIERTALGGGLRLHLVEAGSERILIAENRTGISMLRLAAPDSSRSE